MRDNVFVDTNILVYLYSNSEEQKKQVAHNIVFKSGLEIFISAQVLSEFTNILYRKYDYTLDTIKKAINDFKKNFSISPISIETVESAISMSEIYKYSYWDSLIIAAAKENNCSILYSENLQHSQLLEKKLRIIDPFKSFPFLLPK